MFTYETQVHRLALRYKLFMMHQTAAGALLRAKSVDPALICLQRRRSSELEAGTALSLPALGVAPRQLGNDATRSRMFNALPTQHVFPSAINQCQEIFLPVLC